MDDEVGHIHHGRANSLTCVLLPRLLRVECVDLMDCVVELPLIWVLMEPLHIGGPS